MPTKKCARVMYFPKSLSFCLRLHLWFNIILLDTYMYIYICLGHHNKMVQLCTWDAVVEGPRNTSRRAMLSVCA